MTELLHAGMVIPASIGVCCSVGVGAWSTPAAGSAGRRGRVASVLGRVLAMVAALLMLGAMVDMAFFAGSVPGWAGRSVGWAAVMIAVALCVVSVGRAGGRVAHVDVHRALGLVVTAALVVVAHSGQTDVSGAAGLGGHAGHGGSVAIAPLAVASAVVFAGYSFWMAVRAWPGVQGAERLLGRTPTIASKQQAAHWVSPFAALLRRADVSGMAVMALAMAAMVIAQSAGNLPRRDVIRLPFAAHGHVDGRESDEHYRLGPAEAGEHPAPLPPSAVGDRVAVPRRADTLGRVTESADETIETPIWPAFLVPVLQSLSSGETLHRKDVIRRAADHAGLTESARVEVLSSGGLRYEQRIGWAMSHLSKAGLLDRPQRAHYAITDAGRSFLMENPNGLDYAAAREYFRPFWPQRAARTDGADSAAEEDLAVLDPIEQIEDGIRRNHVVVASELLDRLLESHPDFFEQAVVDLLLGMGYGGVEQRGRRIGGTGDGGVDGVIDQDSLGLDQIYVQAKRYQPGSNVGREYIQAFVGALHGVGATRGVYITTSSFTESARQYARGIPARVILIDGERLVSLMIKYSVGVQTAREFRAVAIDDDYFD